MSESINTPWWANKKIQTVGLMALSIFVVFALIYFDVTARAKEAYLEGEKYMDWAAHPDKKKLHYNALFDSEKKKLDLKLTQKKITPEKHKQDLDVLQFDRDFALQESSLKYAYQWYKDATELFSPPDSKWVKLSREKAKEALALWKKELDAKKIPYQDYMFE